MIDYNAMSVQTARELNCCNDRSEGMNGIHGTSTPWKTSYPIQASTLDCRPYNHQNYYNLSPTSQRQVIAQGQQELMDMIQDVPEGSYELSLKDIVEKPIAQGQQELMDMIQDVPEGSYELSLKDIVEKPIVQMTETEAKDTTQSKKRKNKNKYDKNVKLLRVESMDSGNFLLKMFLPSSLGLKKKKKTDMGPSAKVRLPGVKVENGFDKELWKKKFSIAEENKKNGSTGHISNSGSNNCRNISDLLLSCWSFLYSNKSKITHQKGEDRKTKTNEYSSNFTHKAMKT